MSAVEWVIIGLIIWVVAACIVGLTFALLRTGQKLVEAEERARQAKRLTDRE